MAGADYPFYRTCIRCLGCGADLTDLPADDPCPACSLDPDGGDWTPGPPWLDRLMAALGLLAFLLLTLALAAYAGSR